MKLTPVFLNSETWALMDIPKTNKTRPIANLKMDYMAQADELILWPDVTEEEALSALRLTYSHAVRYVVNRRFSNGIFEVTYNGSVDREASAHLLEEENVPKAADLGAEELVKQLREIGVNVVYAKVTSLREALQTAVADPRLAVPVTFTLGEKRPINLQQVTFKVEAPAHFRGWHSLGKPGSAFDLYIIPADHPDRNPNKHSTLLINGDTDALIGRDAIRYVFAPTNVKDESDKFIMGSWSRTNNPFYVEGQQVTVHASETKALSAEGIEEIVTLLLAMLELQNTYLSISGGFRAPYTLPQNIAQRYHIRTSSYRGEARGSEGNCVWAYQFLKKEGKLQGAYIPQWFKTEGWLEAYEAAGYTLS